MLNGLSQDDFYTRRYIAPILPVAMLSAGCAMLVIWTFYRVVGPFFAPRIETALFGGPVSLIVLAWLCRRFALAGRLHLTALTVILYGGIFAVVFAVRATVREDGLTSVVLPLMILVLIGAMFAQRAWHLLLGYAVTMAPAWLYSREFAPAITPEARNFPQAALFTLATAITFYVLSSRFRRYFYELLVDHDDRARRDPLTQLLNRSVWHERAGEVVRRADAEGRDISVLFADVDRFKQINDRLGHARGDAVLMRVADLLRDVLPAAALIGRYGGEEFVVLLEGCDLERARKDARHLRAALQQEILPDLVLTISVGVACHRSGESLHELLHRADLALLRAKDGGRDRIEAAPDTPAPIRLAAPEPVTG